MEKHMTVAVDLAKNVFEVAVSPSSPSSATPRDSAPADAWPASSASSRASTPPAPPVTSAPSPSAATLTCALSSLMAPDPSCSLPNARLTPTPSDAGPSASRLAAATTKPPSLSQTSSLASRGPSGLAINPSTPIAGPPEHAHPATTTRTARPMNSHPQRHGVKPVTRKAQEAALTRLAPSARLYPGQETLSTHRPKIRVPST